MSPFRPPGEGRVYGRVPDLIEKWSPRAFALMALVTFAVCAAAGLWSPWLWTLFVPWVWVVAIGVRDYTQKHHALLRNYPVLGHLRYVLESLRPELRQYFVESDFEPTPFPREHRSLIYQRAKSELDTRAFGTRSDLYQPGVEWLSHSLLPTHVPPEKQRVLIGAGRCAHPYSAALLNISAMSFGSLSKNAVRAMNQGAKLGGFSHNTGEGGLSPYHLEHGGDLVWQIGTGYFGCRTPEGVFDAEKFKENALKPQVKMVEVKLSQGAKPAHGGLLPAKKVTPEIAAIRGVPMGHDVLSPPAHTAFRGPVELLQFVTRLRELSGKPVGFKLCVGNLVDFLGICRAMVETGLRPDFITVDGAEGGTGAAPVEFSDVVGWPLVDGLTFVNNALRGAGVRDDVKIISAGKIATGFHLVRQLALGANLCNAARAMMMAVGCIQALKCNTNHCPVGVATQDEALMRGLVVETKGERVRSFQARTVEAAMHLIGAAGIDDPAHVSAFHIMRRVSASEAKSLEELYPSVEPGAFLTGTAPPSLQRLWELSAKRLEAGPGAHASAAAPVR